MDLDHLMTFSQKLFIKFGYITCVPVILVICISLFGHIKANYRWFILNQAIIDLFLSYHFICIKFGYNLSKNCSFGLREDGNQLLQILPAIGLLLISGSRCLHVYFSFVNSWWKTWKIIFYILLIDGIFILITGITNFLNSWQSEKHYICLKWILNEYEYTFENITCNKNSIDNIECSYLNKERYQLCLKDLLSDTAYLIYSNYKNYVIPLIYPITLAASILFVLLLIIKLLRQLKIQAIINKIALKSNIRIIIVLSIQTIFLLILGSMEVVHSTYYKTLQKPIPDWLKWLYNNEQTTLAFREIRVFFDAIIILGFMTGYRENLRDAILWPKKNLAKFCKGKVHVERKFTFGQKLIDLVKEFCILDSDYYIDTIADLILHRIEEKEDWQSLKLFFGFTDDFALKEREFIKENPKEFIFSINTEILKFPFQNTVDFKILRNKFYTPLNVLFSRILHRADDKITFKFSIINKSLKNEIDRRPFKFSYFCANRNWDIYIRMKNAPQISLSIKEDEVLINKIKSRKMAVSNGIELDFGMDHDGVLCCKNFDFYSPVKDYPIFKVNFWDDKNDINLFDMRACPFPFIFFELDYIKINFDKFYQKIVANDLSKEIEIRSKNVFFLGEIRIYKKSNASKFYKCLTQSNIKEFQKNHKFQKFLFDYMEEDSVFATSKKWDGIIQSVFNYLDSNGDNKKQYVSQISVVKKYLTNLKKS